MYNSAILLEGGPVDELVVRIARAVACLSRLRILSLLAREGEVAPSELAGRLQMSPAIVCTHVRRLSSVGLVQRRRSGVWRYCRGESPYPEDALSGKVASWLSETLRAPGRALKNCRVVQLCNSSPDDAAPRLHRILFDAATAFTNVRRLQILRYLATAGSADAATLSRELHMSPAAVSRHTSKLMCRGYVASLRAGRVLAYRLAAKCKTPLHARLLGIIRSEWRKAATGNNR